MKKIFSILLIITLIVAGCNSAKNDTTEAEKEDLSSKDEKQVELVTDSLVLAPTQAFQAISTATEGTFKYVFDYNGDTTTVTYYSDSHYQYRLDFAESGEFLDLICGIDGVYFLDANYQGTVGQNPNITSDGCLELYGELNIGDKILSIQNLIALTEGLILTDTFTLEDGYYYGSGEVGNRTELKADGTYYRYTSSRDDSETSLTIEVLEPVE